MTKHPKASSNVLDEGLARFEQRSHEHAASPR